MASIVTKPLVDLTGLDATELCKIEDTVSFHMNMVVLNTRHTKNTVPEFDIAARTVLQGYDEYMGILEKMKTNPSTAIDHFPAIVVNMAISLIVATTFPEDREGLFMELGQRLMQAYSVGVPAGLAKVQARQDAPKS